MPIGAGSDLQSVRRLDASSEPVTHSGYNCLLIAPIYLIYMDRKYTRCEVGPPWAGQLISPPRWRALLVRNGRYGTTVHPLRVNGPLGILP
jgi:hypothetical protein